MLMYMRMPAALARPSAMPEIFFHRDALPALGTGGGKGTANFPASFVTKNPSNPNSLILSIKGVDSAFPVIIG